MSRQMYYDEEAGQLFPVPDVVEQKPLTNADRIRSMADEKLAEFAVSTGQGCAPGKNFVECCFDHKDWLTEADCRKCWLGWLKEEATDDNHDH